MSQPSATGVPDTLLRELAACASEYTGFHRDAILPSALLDVARRELAAGRTSADLETLALRNDPLLGRALAQAVPVGETYFFRQPEHFRLLHERVLPSLTARGRIRAWSAGCATGEEAYSLAACLRAALPADADVEVVGTDLVASNIELARRGVYGRWSVRESGPLLYPILRPVAHDRVRVAEDIRRLVRFEVANLLDARDDGCFDVILCRNVLVYLHASAVHRVLARLEASLAPGGVVLFGTMDLVAPPARFAPIGPPAHQAFTRAPARTRGATRRPPARRPARAEPAPPPPPHPAAPGASVEPVALHIAALGHVERGDRAEAERLLAELAAVAPDYLPALVERALLHGRHDEADRAVALMREAARRLGELPPNHVLAGPVPLTAGFYRALAQAFLDQRGRR